MKNYFLHLAVIISLCTSVQAFGQHKFPAEDLTYLEAIEDTLGIFSHSIVNDSLKEYRFGAVQAFIPTLIRALKTPNSFKYPFQQLQSISIQYPADSTFRIFTWQLYVDKDEYRYYGAIQLNSEELKLFPLIDRSFEIEGDLEQLELTHDEWYGALYYKIVQNTDGPQPHYLLFGFDGFEYFRKRKLIDVLQFKDNKPVFGAPVFVSKDQGGYEKTQNRFILEYSVEASVTCNYDVSRDMIIYDHLQMVGGTYGEGPTFIPDGTYEGFVLENGLWHYNEKVFHEILDEAPRPEPVFNSKKSGLFGG